jgi:hypothetical protein
MWLLFVLCVARAVASAEERKKSSRHVLPRWRRQGGITEKRDGLTWRLPKLPGKLVKEQEECSITIPQSTSVHCEHMCTQHRYQITERCSLGSYTNLKCRGIQLMNTRMDTIQAENQTEKNRGWQTSRELEALSIVLGKIKWFGHFGKQNGSLSGKVNTEL